MKKGSNYTFTQIEKFAKEKGYKLSEVNNDCDEVIGESFIVLRKDDNDMTISFILIDTDPSDFNYECIYSDLP